MTASSETTVVISESYVKLATNQYRSKPKAALPIPLRSRCKPHRDATPPVQERADVTADYHGTQVQAEHIITQKQTARD